ncbi:MAG: RND family transporter, partial [Calditrichaeota bacterium]
MFRLTQLVVKFPKSTIFLTLLCTLLLGYQIRHIKVDPDITSSLPQKIPAKLLYDRMNEIFPSRDMVLIALESDSLFSREVLQLIFQITSHLEDLPNVYSVMSPTNIRLIRGSEEGMEVREILTQPPETPEEIASYRYTLFHSDLPIENIISEDRTMAGIMVFLKNTVKPEDAAKEILDYLNTLETDANIYVTGKPVLTLYLGRGMARDMGILFPMVIVLIMVILWFSFRSLRGVFLPLSVVVFSVIGTIGIMALLGVPISHSTNMLPILLASIAVADGIHILNHYYHRAHKFNESIPLILEVMKDLNPPVIITSVTTACGFLALNASNIGSIGELGIFTSIGVLIAMVYSLTFIPAVLSILKIPRKVVTRKQEGYLLSAATAYGEFLVRHKQSLMIAIGLIIVVSILGFPQIQLENNTVSFFPEDHPARIHHEKINQHFAGTTFLTVMVEGDSANFIKEPQVLQTMVKVEQFLKTLPHVGATISLADYVRRMNTVLHAVNPAYDSIPGDTVVEQTTEWVNEGGKWVEKPVTFKVSGRELIAQYLQLYEMSGKPEDLANLVNYNYQIARINAFIDTGSNNVLREIDRSVRRFIKENFPWIKMELTGTSALFLAINDLVVSGQFLSILVSLLLVTIVTSILFRSVKIGLMNIIPLFFAMVFNFGFMGWGNVYLNIVTMLTSSIAIGVGVDYAVHFIYRYRKELKEKTPENAARTTLIEAGIPIVLNALTVGLGFAVLMFSTFGGV